MNRLGMDKLIGSRPFRERDLVLAMVAGPDSGSRQQACYNTLWKNTTLPEVFDVTGAGEDELYAAMDWLQARQDAIEKKLATRHLQEGGRVLYDLSSSYVEGTHCPLAARVYNRDGKQGSCRSTMAMTSPLGYRSHIRIQW